MREMKSGLRSAEGYLPYCFFNLLSPLMSLLIAAAGSRIYHHSHMEDATDKKRETRKNQE